MSESMDGGREFMSIGEVLSLLHPEFPDITISKIRFLESKGLLDPERTPSGYRKFYPHDIERLKAVLRMQKDTFMPLKVIKDHLGGSDGETQVLLFETEAFGLGDGESSEEVSSSRAGDIADDAMEMDEKPPPASITELSSAMRASLLRLHSTGTTPEESTARRRPVSKPTANQKTSQLTDDSGSRRKRIQFKEQSKSKTRSMDSDSQGQAQPDSGGEPPQGGRDLAKFESDQARPEQAGSALGQGEGVAPRSYTLEEVTASTGAKIVDIAEMIEFGLISGSKVFGETVYSDSEVELIRVILRFRTFGIGARHLKLYKTSAEREFGFLEQVVSPIFRKRNPVASEQARQTLIELRDLGALMRSHFLSRELSKYLD